MWRKHLRCTETAYGKCWFYGKDEYIGRSLFSYGEFSGEECEKLISLVGTGHMLDIGANIGFMSMGVLANGGTVTAIEPQPQLFEMLRKNCPAAECHNVALGNYNGEAKMPKIRYGDKGNYGGLPILQKGETGPLGIITVKICKLNDFSCKASLVKIDVEGYELEVLKGGVEFLERNNWPTLYVEDDRPNKRAALRAFINELGYKIEEHNPPLFRHNNYYGNHSNIWNTNLISSNIVCYK